MLRISREDGRAAPWCQSAGAGAGDGVRESSIELVARVGVRNDLFAPIAVERRREDVPVHARPLNEPACRVSRLAVDHHGLEAPVRRHDGMPLHGRAAQARLRGVDVVRLDQGRVELGNHVPAAHDVGEAGVRELFDGPAFLRAGLAPADAHGASSPDGGEEGFAAALEVFAVRIIGEDETPRRGAARLGCGRGAFGPAAGGDSAREKKDRKDEPAGARPPRHPAVSSLFAFRVM